MSWLWNLIYAIFGAKVEVEPVTTAVGATIAVLEQTGNLKPLNEALSIRLGRNVVIRPSFPVIAQRYAENGTAPSFLVFFSIQIYCSNDYIGHLIVNLNSAIDYFFMVDGTKKDHVAEFVSACSAFVENNSVSVLSFFVETLGRLSNPLDFGKTILALEAFNAKDAILSILSFRGSFNYYTEVLLSQATSLKLNEAFFAISALFWGLVLVYLFSIIVGLALLSISRSKVVSYYTKLQSFFNNDLSNNLDLFLILALFFSFLNIIFFSSLYSNSQSISSLMLTSLLGFISLNLTLPMFYCLAYGTYFLVFLRGDSSVKGALSLAMKDLITLLSFKLRFFVQGIRIGLVACVIFLLKEFIHTGLVLGASSNVTVTLLVSIFRALFEYVDMLIIVFLQLFAFVAILFWLFSFIFTVKDSSVYERFFINKS